MLGNLGQLGELKKMYDKYKELQKKLKKLLIRASVGDFVYTDDKGEDKTGSVVVTITGEMQITSVDIKDTALLSPDRKDDVESLIMEAMQKAQKKAQEVVAAKTKEVLGFDPSDLAGMMGGGGMPSIPGLG